MRNSIEVFAKAKISAKNIKKGLKAYGVKVMSCKTVNQGVNVVVDPSSKDDANKFFNEFDLKSSASMAAGVVCSGSDWIQFSTLFKFIKK